MSAALLSAPPLSPPSTDAPAPDQDTAEGALPADLIFARALAGQVCWAHDAHGRRVELPARRWLGGPELTAADRAVDELLLGRCTGSTLDLGCGPGRLTAALAARGVASLGVDSSALAVRLTLARGGLALQRDLYGELPGEGRWARVLLADGNVGIDGDPERVLRRAHQLVALRGAVVCEIDATGPLVVDRLCLETEDGPGAWFRWARIGADHVGELAARAGLRPVDVAVSGDRAVVVLEKESR